MAWDRSTEDAASTEQTPACLGSSMAPTKSRFAGPQKRRSQFKSRPREFVTYAFLINNLRNLRGKCWDTTDKERILIRKPEAHPAPLQQGSLDQVLGALSHLTSPRRGLGCDRRNFGATPVARVGKLPDRSYHDVPVIHFTDEEYIHSKRKSLDTLPVVAIPNFASFA
jgi:hypothetical protein